MSQEKEAQNKFYKTREDNEIEKVIALENKVKVLDDIVYKIDQSIQTMNMLNRNCKTSFVKPEYLKKAQRANPRLYDIGCYNDNLALMLAPESEETIRLAHESRSKLSDLIKPFVKNKISLTYDDPEVGEDRNEILILCIDNLGDMLRPQIKTLVLFTCGKCVLNDNHDMCVLHYINGMNSRTKMPMVVPINTREPKRTVNQSVQHPLREQLLQNPLTKNLEAQLGSNMSRLVRHVNGGTLVEIILFIVDSGCSKHMTGNLKLLSNFVEQFLGMVKFRNDQIAPILGYGDLVQGNVTIKRVYYVEGLNHNLLSVGQFCDADLYAAFWKSACYIRDLKGNDLLTGSPGTDLYSITLQDTSAPNPICLMAKASSSQAWLWHRRLLHLNFDTINLLSKYDIVTGHPKLKFFKDHLCSSYELGKAKRKLKWNPNITMEEYIRLEEEKARKRGKMYNWKTATYGKIWYDEDVLDPRSVKTEFPAIVFNDTLTLNETPSCEPTVSSHYFENEFPAIVYNDALTSKSDLLTEPTISPRHIDEFDLKDETSLSECDEKEQNVLYFNDFTLTTSFLL
ncbi:retrovirus-related pol polyprotein from transposon TNT 1-94 [Tanacetum coccineum]